MKYFLLIISTFCAGLPLFIPVANNAHAQPVILENFMGFDCAYSLQKTDILKKIRDRKDTLTLNCHLTIDQGENEYALQACSQKRGYYVVRDITTGQETPYSVINGRYKSVGADPGIHMSAINLAKKETPLISFPLKIDNKTLTAELPRIDTEAPLDLWLYAYDFENKIVHKKGNTRMGSDIPHGMFRNMVKKLDKLGDWHGYQESIVIPLHNFRADGFALIAQEQYGGPILALGKVEPGLSSQTSRSQN